MAVGDVVEWIESKIKKGHGVGRAPLIKNSSQQSPTVVISV